MTPEIEKRLDESAINLRERYAAKSQGLFKIWTEAVERKAAIVEDQWTVEPEARKAVLGVIHESVQRLNDKFNRLLNEFILMHRKYIVENLKESDAKFLDLLGKSSANHLGVLQGLAGFREMEVDQWFAEQEAYAQKMWNERIVTGEMPAMMRLLCTPFHELVISMFPN